jgi:hypothetical protein
VSLNSLVIDNVGFVLAFAIPAIGLPLIGIVFAVLLGRKAARS